MFKKEWLLIIFIIIYATLPKKVISINNVCTNDEAYNDINDSNDCYYNPNLDLSLPEIIIKDGYPLEIYKVTTRDQYILTIFRIPHNNKEISGPRQPIFLQHGLNINSLIWVDKYNRSLVENGYDVWIGNSRGSEYSKNHMYLYSDPFDKQYWSFSLHHLGVYDVSSQIKQIAKITRKKIIYMGHSMGTTMSYIYATARKNEAKKYLNGIISLAPVAYVHNSPAETMLFSHAPIIKTIILGTGAWGIFSSHIFKDTLLTAFKTNATAALKIMREIMFALKEGDYPKVMPDEVPLFFRAWFDGIGLLVFLNFVQIQHRKELIGYDYGPIENKKLYGSIEPMIYNLSEINVPVHLFHGIKDTIADAEDVQLLYEKLTTKKYLTKITEDGKMPFSHTSFMYGEYFDTYLYGSLLKAIKNFNCNTKHCKI